MTAGGFREVDHDLLADYLGGALDGTPDEAVVAGLVQREPAWAVAHDALAAALPRVGLDLATWAESPVEMPPAVADRIAAALADAGGVDTGGADADGTDAGGTDAGGVDTGGTDTGGTDTGGVDNGGVDNGRPAGGVRPALVPAQPSPGARRPVGGTRPATGPTGAGPGRRGRRWARIAGPVALATASVFAVGLGLNHLVDGNSQSDSGVSTTIGEQAAPGGANPNGSFRTAGAPQRSGTDWTPEALAAAPRTDASKSSGREPLGPEVAGDERLPAVGSLDRLGTRPALGSCLTAVSAEHGAGLLTVDLVDYARFRGAPALVLRFVDPSGARWAWVSGPECGVPGSGADTRYRARVG
ncbi:hypothetical protein [Micromonospora sp. DT233]|uniref:hypothetical protein n=1 Tax=Micromonospora sp. DT233 TaxID=3393432 RepID=UPI003CEBAD47